MCSDQELNLQPFGYGRCSYQLSHTRQRYRYLFTAHMGPVRFGQNRVDGAARVDRIQPSIHLIPVALLKPLSVLIPLTVYVKVDERPDP